MIMGLNFFEDVIDKMQGLHTIIDDEEDADKEMDDFNNINMSTRENSMNKKIKITESVKNLILNVFENFETLSEEVIQTILDKYEQQKREILQKENYDSYNSNNQIYKQIKNDEDDDYTFLNFEDFLLIFIKIIHYYTGLNIKIFFTEIEKTITISLFGNEEQIDKLAEKNKYELQLKNYAYKFQIIIDNYEKQHFRKKITAILNAEENLDENNKNLLYTEAKERINDKEWIPIKYSEITVNNVLYFSPFMKFIKDKEEKYQRYEKNDDLHECNGNLDEICGNGCSKFRNIDKLRNIYFTLDKLVRIKYLINEKILDYILIKRNYIDYGDKLTTSNIVLRSWNIFNFSKTIEFLYTVRNFYGEEVAFYFLWLNSYIKWLLFPAVVGIIFNFFYKYLNFKDGTHNPIWSLLICLTFILWSSTFLNHWTQKEKLFSYIWGTEDYQQNEPDRESFKPDGYRILLLGQKFPYINKAKLFLKKTLSYFVLIIMIGVVLIFVNYIFYIKALLIKRFPKSPDAVGVFIGIVNTIQINILSTIYKSIATYLNNLENYRKEYISNNYLAVKLIIYDFVNSYYSLFFIGFVKKSTLFGKKYQKCIGFHGNDSCTEELEIQLYTILFIRFIFNFWEIGKPILSQGAKIISLSKNLAEIGNSLTSEIKPHSIEHQMICTEYNSMICEYSEMIINLGFVLLFGACAPLVPAYVFLLGYMEKFFDAYKIFFLERVQLLNQCNGLKIFNTIIQYFIYIGLICNSLFVIYGDNYFMPDMGASSKILLYVGFVFVSYMGTVLVPWYVLPPWFEYLSEIKELYFKKYFSRDSDDLPHLRFTKMVKMHEKCKNE